MKQPRASVLLALALAAATNICMADSLLRVTCEGDDAGAEVLVNGKFKGECPVDVKVHEGTAKLRVQKAVDARHDPRLFEQDVRVGDGVVKKIEAHLGAAQLNAEGRRKAAEANCPDCPEMVVIPGGLFQMGSPDAEADHQNDEGPVHQVDIAEFAIGKYEVTVGEFRKFVQATGYKTTAETDKRQESLGCYNTPHGAANRWEAGLNWNNPGFSQGDRNPVVCVSWLDAQAYAVWLRDKTGKSYRLPTESEWEYAARAGTTSARYWAGDASQACQYANANDQTEDGGYHWNTRFECNDGRWFTAPVGSYQPNPFGLYDVLGNAWEWVADNYSDNYVGAPVYGFAWNAGSADKKVRRGAGWDSAPKWVRAGARSWSGSGARLTSLGFRLAMTMPSDSRPPLKRDAGKAR